MARKKPKKPVKQKRAIRLDGSDEVLRWPNDDIETEVLERILTDAKERKVEDSRLILVTYQERVLNFNTEDPRYKQLDYRRKLSELKELYRRITGRDEPPSDDELRKRAEKKAALSSPRW